MLERIVNGNKDTTKTPVLSHYLSNDQKVNK